MGFFDTLFGKKKDKEVKKEEKKEDKKDKPQQPAQQAKGPVQQKPQSAQQIKAKQSQQPQNEDEWVYELVLQYLVSPIWKVTISEFLDEHCIVFDDEEENKFSYFDIHKKFKKMMENLVDGMLAEIGIVEDQFGVVVERGLKSHSHSKYFEQLLIIDNFLVFKKLMIKRNKENELEALRELQKQDDIANPGKVRVPNQDIKKAEQDKEKADLEHAMALSKAVEQERKKLLDDEEDQYQQVLRMSEIEYKKQQLQKKAREEEEQRLQQQQNQNNQQPPIPIKPDSTPTPVQRSQQVNVKKGDEAVEEQKSDINKPSMLQFYGNSEVQNAQAVQSIQVNNEEVQIKKKLTKLQPMEPLVSKVLPPIQNSIQGVGQRQEPSLIGFDNHDEEQAQRDREAIKSQIQKLKQQQVEVQEEPVQVVESTEDRKKRLLQQRELIRKKKQQENDKQLSNYQQEQQQQQQQIEQKNDMSEFIEQQKKSTTDAQRRRELLEQKKKQLLMNKIKEDVNYEENLE